MQISGDKTIQFLTQQYVFANVFVSLEGLRSAPAKCQKRFVVHRAQSFGCRICTAPQPWSMTRPTRLCHQLLVKMEDKTISREWPGSQNGQGLSKRPASASVRRCQILPCYWAAIPASSAGSSTRCFFGWRGVGLLIGKRVSYMEQVDSNQRIP